jgi:hypothetical protein
MKTSLFFICIFLLSACSSVYQFTIEVQEPAEVTLPPHIVDISVVNNAAPQPGDKGITRIYKGNKVEYLPLNLDSVANIAAISLANQLQESAFFNRIWVSAATLRTDNNWMGSEPIPTSFKTELFETHGFSGLVSIDRLLFKLDQELRNSLYTHLQVSSIATCTVQIYDRETPLTTFSVSDSLTLTVPFMGDTLEALRYIPQSVIEDMAYSIGEKLSRRIIPSWTEQERTLYAGSRARMAEALSFARNNNWNRAVSLWIDEYNRASRPEAKAKMASNLAVAYEMLDQFSTALQWATAAQTHLQEAAPSPSSPPTPAQTRIAAYINDLNKRIRDNYLLDLQLGGAGE